MFSTVSLLSGRRARIGALSLLLTATLLPALAHAQSDWPTRPVRIVVPFAAGGTTDIVARVLAEQLAPVLKQPVVVENKAGAGGNVAAAEVAKSTPDGYTFLMGTPGTQAINQFLYPKMPYDTERDLIPVSFAVKVPNVLVVHPSVGARTIQEFIDKARAKPGAMSYGSPGNGSTGQLSSELFKTRAKVFITHIPYRGAGPALNDTVAGQVQIIFDNLPSALPFIQQKRLIPIVVAAPQRLTVLADVPTFKEVGLEPVNRMAYYGIIGPKNLPKEVVDKVNAGVRKALEDPAVRKRIEDTGSLIVANTPEQFAAQMKAEFEVYKKVVDSAGLKLE
jgi:tripartite-type tricarboxylate transporter receptor subunit TctC